MNYVKLITEAYFKVNTSARYDFELRKELFQQILVRKHSVLEQKKHITKKEFLTQCGLALNKVRNHVIETLEFREHPRNSYIKNIKDNIFVEIADIGGKSNRELSEDELNELDKMFGFIAMLYHKTNQLKQTETEPKAPQQSEKTEPPYTPKPCFNPESINDITKDLNTFFDASQHAELKRIIETGSDAQTKLLFMDSGNRLSDYFKKMIESDTITGCDKTDLINWIVKNFKYTYRKSYKEFIPKTVEKTISGNLQPCKNPIA